MMLGLVVLPIRLINISVLFFMCFVIVFHFLIMFMIYVWLLRWLKFCLLYHTHFPSLECFLAYFFNSFMVYLVAGLLTSLASSMLNIEQEKREKKLISEAMLFRLSLISRIHSLTFVHQFLLTILVCVWYHTRYIRIRVIHHDFPKATKCSLCKIMFGHRDFDTFTVIPNIGLISMVIFCTN
jgi:hypothetical protein